MLSRRVDGGWGWVVVVAVLCSQLLLGGFCLSGGLFYLVYIRAFQESPVTTSWLCSMPITMWFCATPVGSIIVNRYGCRVCAFLGGLLAALGLSLSYFATNISFLFFSYGFLTGFGFGINYTGCMAAINLYFDKYKTIASGIVSIGHNAGLVMYSWIIPLLETEYGWRGAMLIHGACAFNLCTCAVIMKPLPSKQFTQATIEDKNTKIKLMEDRKSSPSPFRLFRKYSFVCFCASNVLVSVGNGIFILHLPSFAKTQGYSNEDIGTILTVNGITNVIGKVIYSALGHHPNVNVVAVYSVSVAVTAVCVALTPLSVSRVTLSVLSGSVGFFYCVTGALLIAVIYSIVGYKRFADGVGMSLPFKASGNMIGGPTAGFLYSVSGTYTSSFLLAGISMFVSAVLMIPPVIHSRRHSSLRNTVTELQLDADDSTDKLVKERETMLLHADDSTDNLNKEREIMLLHADDSTDKLNKEREMMLLHADDSTDKLNKEREMMLLHADDSTNKLIKEREMMLLNDEHNKCKKEKETFKMNGQYNNKSNNEHEIKLLNDKNINMFKTNSS